jgi:hypothetical protein
MGNTIEEKCGDFYTPEEIAQMKSEITEAICSICLEEIKTEPLPNVLCVKIYIVFIIRVYLIGGKVTSLNNYVVRYV